VETHADQPELNRPRAAAWRSPCVGNQNRPWALSAALSPAPQGHRRLQFEARKVVLDDLLAFAHGRSRIPATPWCRPRSIPTSPATACRRRSRLDLREGRLDRQSGRAGASDSITSAEFGLDWNAARRTLRVPFKVTAVPPANLACRIRGARVPGGNWLFALAADGSCSIPLTAEDEGLVLKRVVMRQHRSGSAADHARGTATWEQELAAPRARRHRRGVRQARLRRRAASGAGLPATPMPAAAFKRLWPAFLSPKVRDWVFSISPEATSNVSTSRPTPPSRRCSPPVGMPRGLVGRNRRQRGDAWPVAGCAIRDADMTLA